MAINIISNFNYRGQQFDFERQYITTLAGLKSAVDTDYPDGYEVYCSETGFWYEFKSSNSVDETTGKFRKRKSSEETPTIDLIDNLTTQTSGQGALDARQGYELKKLIDAQAPFIIDLDKLRAGASSEDIVASFGSWDALMTALTNQKLVLFKSNTDNEYFVLIDAKIVANATDKEVNLYYANNSSIAKANIKLTSGTTTKTLSSTAHLTAADLVNDLNSDATNKGLAAAQGKALKALIDTITNSKNKANGIAGLDANGKLSADVIPGGYDDIQFLVSFVTSNPASGMTVGDKYYNSTSKKILTATSATAVTEANPDPEIVYITKDTNKSYRWNGTDMSVVGDGSGVALGTTSSTAFRGDYGQELYEWMTNGSNKEKLNNLSNLLLGAASGDIMTIDAQTDKAIITVKKVDVSTGSESQEEHELGPVTEAAVGLATPSMMANINKLMDQSFPFSVQSLNSNKGNLFEVGTSQDIIFSWSYQNADMYPIKTQTFDGASVPVGTLNKEVTGVNATKSFTLNATTQSGKTGSKSITITFVNASYTGAVAANFVANENNIKVLPKAIRANKASTQTYNLTNQKICYAYPKSFGALTSIKDGNNFEILPSYTQSEVQVDGVAYYVYILNDAATSTGVKQIFA